MEADARLNTWKLCVHTKHQEDLYWSDALKTGEELLDHKDLVVVTPDGFKIKVVFAWPYTHFTVYVEVPDIYPDRLSHAVMRLLDEGWGCDHKLQMAITYHDYPGGKYGWHYGLDANLQRGDHQDKRVVGPVQALADARDFILKLHETNG